MTDLSATEASELQRTLRDTLKWCQRKMPIHCPSRDLRSSDLAPRISESPEFVEIHAALSMVVAKRRELVREDELLGRHEGRILVAALDNTFWDGASEAASGGFFDVYDRPPWDTWLFCFQSVNRFHTNEMISYMLSWVPASLIQLVDSGIRVNPGECIYWSSNAPAHIAQTVREYVVATLGEGEGTETICIL